jgi:hypothetical protein
MALGPTFLAMRLSEYEPSNDLTSSPLWVQNVTWQSRDDRVIFAGFCDAQGYVLQLA